jgi:hypothetical protein
VSAPLGDAFANGTIGPAGSFNAGNWTVKFDASLMGISLSRFECYHIVISGPAGSSFRIFIDNKIYDNVSPGDVNSWDPNQPMKLTQGNTVYFYWNTGAGTPPTVTLYFQEPSPL